MPATISDVARRAQVSVATVSRALRGLPNVSAETRERVLRAAEELRYVADPHASRLAAGRTSTVGLLVPKIGQWYYAKIFDVVDGFLGDEGYDVLPFALAGPGARERFLQRMPFRKRVDGLIVVDVPLGDDHLERMAQSAAQIVTVGLRTARFSSLTVDNVNGARLAVEHLIGLGHHRIGLIGGIAEERYVFQIPRDRYEGYLQAHRSKGIRADPSLTVEAPVSMSGGAEAMQVLLHRDDPPTAVFAMSDEMAIGALQVASNLGLHVPTDLSIVGFDDHEMAEFIGLTTIRQGVEEQALRAAEWILAAIRGDDTPRHDVLRTRLVVRQTTARPNRV